MSTLSIAPSFTLSNAPSRTVRRSAPAAVRLTRRGRLTLVFGFLALALTAMTIFGGLAIATKDAGTPAKVDVIQVQPGDTLYGIAGDLAKDGEIRSMVHQIQQLNSLSGPELEAGQSLAVPAP